MLIPFFFKLREAAMPVSIKEYLMLLDALGQGVGERTVDDFYYLARTCLVKDETLYDRFWFRYLFRYELEHLLARAGFAIEHVYNDFDRSPWGSVDPGEIIIVATRAS